MDKISLIKKSKKSNNLEGGASLEKLQLYIYDNRTEVEYDDEYEEFKKEEIGNIETFITKDRSNFLGVLDEKIAIDGKTVEELYEDYLKKFVNTFARVFSIALISDDKKIKEEIEILGDKIDNEEDDLEKLEEERKNLKSELYVGILFATYSHKKDLIIQFITINDKYRGQGLSPLFLSLFMDYIKTIDIIPEKISFQYSPSVFMLKTYDNKLNEVGYESEEKEIRDLSKEGFKLSKQEKDILQDKYYKKTLTYKKIKKGSGRVEIPLSLEEPDYDFKLKRGWSKVANPLVETILPPFHKALLNKFTLKQMKDAIKEMNEMGLTNVQGFSQIGRKELVNLIYENPEYFGIPRIKIMPKKKTYFNYEDKQDNENEAKKSHYTEIEDLEQNKKRYFRAKEKKKK